MTTTLNKIRKHAPCANGWEKLLSTLGKTKADDEVLSIEAILDSNGLADVLWCLRAVDGYDYEIRAFARFCAMQNIEKIKPYTSDEKYKLIVDWLETCNEELREAADSAARLVADSAARSVADSVAWSAADSAADSAAECKAQQEAELRRILNECKEMKS